MLMTADEALEIIDAFVTADFAPVSPYVRRFLFSVLSTEGIHSQLDATQAAYLNGLGIYAAEPFVEAE